MTRNARIKSVVRGVKYGAQEAEGRAKLTAGKATGNDRLRRKGKAGELESRLNRFASKIKDATSANRDGDPRRVRDPWPAAGPARRRGPHRPTDALEPANGLDAGLH